MDRLTAVLTIDFDVGELSAFIGRPPLAGARTLMFTADGTVLAYPSVPIPDVAKEENRVLRYPDFKDPALDALFAAIGSSTPAEQRFLQLATPDGDYLASVATVGGAHAGTSAPVQWFLATLVPEKTLFGASWKFGRDTILASVAALAIAFGFALDVRVEPAADAPRGRRGARGGEVRRRAGQAARQLPPRRAPRRRRDGRGLARRAPAAGPAGGDQARAAGGAPRRPVRPVVLERFRREAQTLASLRSRHTIELYDYGVTADGSFFFVMELLDGLDLSQLVISHGPQPAARVISILAQACQSLAEAHDAGLFHRDIKPANLFLCRAADEVDIVKLLDFGIVHDVADPVAAPPAPEPDGAAPPAPASTGERLTVVGTVIGTPGYIAPEQAVGAPRMRAAISTRSAAWRGGC